VSGTVSRSKTLFNRMQLLLAISNADELLKIEHQNRKYDGPRFRDGPI
jgi:hypothetical protein